ncbi:flagellar export protein FliJ [Acidihalobacter ferrooxydans]|uniref:Flagellar FliJ protein n=1 Tax=Acidihalobacter ferrooxydans TaxID=1765967 RepID=A0A1P8UGP5_9GAMM|nr:flagellar export protein FliJ [Acidihalobacter ferrooxydans]APZ43005.1 flagellar export protein FliJ [Acidihalobacter ferrooxydans]
MKRSQRIGPARELAARQERKAVQDLGHQLERLKQASQRLEELLNWEREYATRQQQGVATISQLHSHRQFMLELGRAIEAQRVLTQEAEQSVASARASWQSRQAQHAAVSRVIERCEATERRADDRREQQTLDEFHLARWTHERKP